MCDHCALIDYRVADCWRPCYVPPRATHAMPRPGRIYNEDDFAAQESLTILRQTLLHQQKQIGQLKAQNTALRKGPTTKQGTTFLGIE